jgi:3-polyprenyl-4-hydroxybenzoate decarboxylase
MQVNLPRQRLRLREALREQGPYGDHTGYYTLPEAYPAFHVTAVRHRKEAVYPATIVGTPPMEGYCLGGATKKLPGEGFKPPWRPLIRMSAEIRRKIEALLGVTTRRWPLRLDREFNRRPRNQGQQERIGRTRMQPDTPRLEQAKL